MSVTLIILLIIGGLLFVMLEILVIPGIGVVGIMGAAMIIFAIISAYGISPNHGHIALVSSFALSVALIYISIKTKTWQRISLSHEIEGRVNTREVLVSEGETGVTISRLNPMGKALINENLYEVESKEGYISENKEIVVVKATPSKITVKLKSLN
jgi:membrane-bound ClpP family serine protease